MSRAQAHRTGAACERKHGAIRTQLKTDLVDGKHSSVELFICENFAKA